MAILVEDVSKVCQVQPSVGYVTHCLVVYGEVLFDEGNWSQGRQGSVTKLKLPATAVVYDISTRSKQMTFRETRQETADGVNYGVTIEGTYVGMSPVFDWARGQESRRWAAIWRDTLGNCYVAGIGFNGFRLGLSHAAAERNGHALVLNGVFLDRPWRLAAQPAGVGIDLMSYFS